MTDDIQRFVANPVVVAVLDDGILLKRGSIEVKILGRAVGEVVTTMLNSLAQDARTRAEILGDFPTVMHESIASVVDALLARQILRALGEDEPPRELESSTELFFSENGVSPAVFAECAARRFAVLGVNAVSAALVSALRGGGLERVSVIDVPTLRSVHFLGRDGRPTSLWPSRFPTPVGLAEFIEGDAEFDCLVGTSDFGGLQLLREWNRFAVDAGVAFFPVVLQNMRGYLGPLVVPGETACFECYRARQNSHMTDPKGQRASEHVAHATQLGVSSHPAMAAALGNLAGLELTKFFVSRIAGWHVGTAFEIDMLDLTLERRKVLRVPRCTVCDRGVQQSAVSLDEKLFIPHQARGD